VLNVSETPAFVQEGKSGPIFGRLLLRVECGTPGVGDSRSVRRKRKRSGRLPTMAEQPTLTWHVLNPETQVGQDGDRIVAVLYTVVAANSEGSEWLEFCSILTGPPVHDEVLFGVGHGTGEWWDNRWDRGRAATEYVYFDAVGRWPTD